MRNIKMSRSIKPKFNAVNVHRKINDEKSQHVDEDDDVVQPSVVMMNKHS